MNTEDAQIQTVGISGSPNNVNEIHFDVRETYITTPLLGTLLSLEVPVQNQTTEENLLVLGQVSTIETENRWHEDPSLKNFIKINGALPHLTKIGDITTGTLQIIGAYKPVKEGKKKYTKSRLSVPPGSGLDIQLVNSSTITSIMADEIGYGYLGYFYGSNNVPAPVNVKHFGEADSGGSGEAFMGGVFGPSGSGKSVIAGSLISLWAHNPEMGVLILDPKGDFTTNFNAGQGTGFDFDFYEILSKTSGGRFDASQHVISLDQLRLEGAEIFVQILIEKGFLKALGLTDGRKTADTIENIQRLLEGLEKSEEWKTDMGWDEINRLSLKVKAKKSTKRKVEDAESTPGEVEMLFGQKFTQEMAIAYTDSQRETKATAFYNNWQDEESRLKSIWDETASLFSNKTLKGEDRVSVHTILDSTIQKGKIYILDLNPTKIQMSSDFKIYLVDFIFRKLRNLSYVYYRNNNPGNCLIVLDEAGRFIPQDAGGNERLRALSKQLTDNVKEMRAMRCGFMFVTQTIAEIQKEIFRQLHFRIYGVGLGIGVDAQHIVDKEGQDAYDLYKSLPDPRLSGTFSFMVAGVLISLGSSGRPMVIEGLNGQDLLKANSHFTTKVEPRSIGTVVVG